MTRLFINSDLLSILGECNIYYINHKCTLLYLGLENSTSGNQNFISNKKNHTLIFWRGNKGNMGNNVYQILKLQQSKIPTFGVFNSPYSPFPFCINKLPTLFFKDFLGESSVLCNTDGCLVFCSNLRKVILRPSISRNGFSKMQLPIIKKPPGKVVALLSFYVMFFIF